MEMWIQSRSVQFGEHLFTHKVDLYPDTDLDQWCLVNRAYDIIAWEQVPSALQQTLSFHRMVRAVGLGKAGEASASPLFSRGHAHMGSLLLDPSILLSW